MIKPVGAHYLGDKKARFCVWAPLLEGLSLRVVSPQPQQIPLVKDELGYWNAEVQGMEPASHYFYQINGKDVPDPASFYQPHDILGPSSLVDHGSFPWKFQRWDRLSLQEMIIYELHVGTFTPQGDFKGVISKLDYLKELGINAIEIMPVAQFPGTRNWGYDGVFPFAVQHSYGGPDDLKALVDAAHSHNIAVVLDVVYNHLGPQGNVLGSFMPYASNKYRTPWGNAINFDDEYSYGVRDFFIYNALYWFEHYHIDALRLDAVHGIYDMGAKHFLAELSQEVDKLSLQHSKKFYLIAESDLNDERVILPRKSWGYGMDAQWSDDLHHSIHTLLTGESQGYYADFGSINHLADAFKKGFVYTWNYSRFRKRHHGSDVAAVPANQLVVFSQNHDQVGNRLKGDRLSTLIPFEALKLAASSVILSSSIPMLFMGEEYGEEAPFLYFTDFSDEKLIEAVREGRKNEFKAFGWKEEPQDAFDEKTFLQCKLRWEKRQAPHHQTLFKFYQHLIALRKTKPALSCQAQTPLEVNTHEKDKMVIVTHRHQEGEIKVFLNFDRSSSPVAWNHLGQSWQLILDSSQPQWLGPGSQLPTELQGEENILINPLSCVCYEKRTG